MKVDDDFLNRIKHGYSLMNINVLYYMPDHHFIVQEFYWQTMDLSPKYPRVNQFLFHWKNEIEAVIKEIQIQETSYLTPTRFRKIDDIIGYN